MNSQMLRSSLSWKVGLTSNVLENVKKQREDEEIEWAMKISMQQEQQRKVEVLEEEEMLKKALSLSEVEDREQSEVFNSRIKEQERQLMEA